MSQLAKFINLVLSQEVVATRLIGGMNSSSMYTTTLMELLKKKELEEIEVISVSHNKGTKTTGSDQMREKTLC